MRVSIQKIAFLRQTWRVKLPSQWSDIYVLDQQLTKKDTHFLQMDAP